MGVITDFFIASREDVFRVLQGWKFPPPLLEAPVVVQGVNPFTKEPIQIKTRLNRDLMPAPDPEADPSPDIGSLPNVRAKGLLPDKLAIVFATLGGLDFDGALELITYGGLIGPPETEVSVEQLPAAFTECLADAHRDDLLRAAQAIEEEEVQNWGDSYRGSAQSFLEVLLELSALASRCRAEKAELFVWMSP